MAVMIRTYTVLAHQAEEGGYWAEVLELPGCVSQGETVEELRHNIREAVEAVLQEEARESSIDFQVESPVAEKDGFTLRVGSSEGVQGWRLPESETWTAAA